MHVLLKQTVYVLPRVLFWRPFPELRSKEGNTKITPEWTHKQSANTSKELFAVFRILSHEKRMVYQIISTYTTRSNTHFGSCQAGLLKSRQISECFMQMANVEHIVD